jgi:hypothetical protein
MFIPHFAPPTIGLSPADRLDKNERDQALSLTKGKF